MPATTRRQAAAHSVSGPPPDVTGPSDVEKHLRTALHGVARLRKEIEQLTRENTRLKEDLERIYEAQDVSIQPKPGKRGNTSVLSLTAQVNKLKRQVTELEDARKKDKRKIRKLQLKEVKKDAMELGDELEYGIHDESADMKRILRRFSELMSTPSIEEKEECAICLTEMTLENAMSLPCQHVFCASCLPNIDPPNCPNCRQAFGTVEKAEPVQFTATEQWDALLEVAAEWSRIDKDESPGETEEEELPFIEDDEEANATVSDGSYDPGYPEENGYPEDPSVATPSAYRIRRPALSTPPPDVDASRSSQAEPPSTPSRSLPSPVSYQSSPLSVKRQRMRELADARISKRSRR